MNISIFCGASLPHSEQITEAARQLGRAIARGGHSLLYGGSNLGLMGALPHNATPHLCAVKIHK